MANQNIDLAKYFKLGTLAVCLKFPDTAFALQACRHIFLSDDFQGQILATIDYVQDESIGSGFSDSGHPNVVGIARQDLGNGGQRILLRIFDEFTVALDFHNQMIQVRYPSCAPVRLLLDDVLQAAMQPILERIGGFILHGACMVRDGKAIVFMGDSGAGKSTSAFNLTRFGFQCYADDAVLVTPSDEHLVVWPLSREFSLRPLSFNLFERQNILLGEYNKDGQKYYFSQEAEDLSGAKLKHICFIELSGDAETFLTELDQARTLKVLGKSDRHFSFMARHEAAKYAQTLVELTPGPILGRVGTDLNYQGGVFDALFLEKPFKTTIKKPATLFGATRKEKMALIRQLWSPPELNRVAELIPLLGDFDPQIFKLALSFFQTLPVAKLRMISSPIAFPIAPSASYVPWLHGDRWLKGCEALLREAGLEVLRRFAYSWITSAPVIYPFLKILLAHISDGNQSIELAWQRFLNDARDTGPSGRMPTTPHLLNGAALGQDQLSSIRNGQSPQLIVPTGATPFILIPIDSILDWEILAANLRQAYSKSRLTLIPVLGTSCRLDEVAALFNQLFQYGMEVKIDRHIPLCCLNAADAGRILHLNGFDYAHIANAVMTRAICCSKRGPTESFHFVPVQDNPLMERFVYREKPFLKCETCVEFNLGLCRGGFFTAH